MTRLQLPPATGAIVRDDLLERLSVGLIAERVRERAEMVAVVGDTDVK
jgi:hypothetical protein